MEFRVDLDHLDQVVSRLSSLVGFFTEHLDHIDERVAAISGAGWEGRAARAYADAHREWSAGAREFVQGVQEMHTAALAAHQRYTTAFDTNKTMFTGA